MRAVLVTGGSGTVGPPLVSLLGARGDEVQVLSRCPGAGPHGGDLATGIGAQVVAESPPAGRAVVRRRT